MAMNVHTKPLTLQTSNTEMLAEQQERELPEFLRNWWPSIYSSVAQFELK